MGNVFSKLKRRFRRNSVQQLTDARRRNISRDVLLHEVTEKSLLVDACKLTSKRRSRHPDHHRYWESPFEKEAHTQPAVLSICINRDLGIGEITSLCHRFRFEDEERYRSEVTREQGGTSGHCSTNEATHRDSRHKRRSRQRREAERVVSSEDVDDADKQGGKNDKLGKKDGSESNGDNNTPTESEKGTNQGQAACHGQKIAKSQNGQASEITHDEQAEHKHAEADRVEMSKLTQNAQRPGVEGKGECNIRESLSEDNGKRKEIERETTPCDETKNLPQTAENYAQDQCSDTVGAIEKSMATDFMNMHIGQCASADAGSTSGTNSSSLADYSSSSQYTYDSFDSNDDISTSSSPNASESFESDEDQIKQFPAFVTPFLNKDVRIRLQFHRAIHSTFNSTFKKCEPVHLWRHVKYIDARFLGQPVQKRMEIMLEESHGSRRQLFGNSRRSRPLFPRAIIVNTCEETPGLYVAGKEFSILLAPPPGGPQELEDGRALHAIGTYVRYLDTDQNYLMLWRASVVEDVIID